HVELALVVGGAARVQVPVANLRLEWVAVPELERVRRLHVEVAVAEDRRRAVARRGANLADRERLAVPVDELGFASRLPQQPADPLPRFCDVAGMRRIRAHR